METYKQKMVRLVNHAKLRQEKKEPKYRNVVSAIVVIVSCLYVFSVMVWKFFIK
jgi:hypothetical protein